MTSVNREIVRGHGSGLERVIEPLASYICAADEPRAALISALTVLVHEVCQTNRAASAHLATYLENHAS
jgi:hypothetical protein